MCAEWVRGFDIGLLARKLDDAKVVREDSTFFEGTAAEDATAVLLSSLKFEPGVPEIEQVRILDASMRAAGAGGRVTKEALMTEVNRREEDYLTKPEQQFVVATTVALKPAEELRNIEEVGGHEATFERCLPRRFLEEHVRVVARQRFMSREDLPAWPLNRHTAVRMTVEAKTPHEAALAAANALTLLRATWNLFFNMGTIDRPFFAPTPRRPVNKVLPGPVYTVHSSDGDAASDTVWFEISYQRPVEPYDVRERDWPELWAFEARIREQLAEATHRGQLEDALRRYVQAFDTPDWNASFLQLWALLEHLTGTNRHPEVAKRVLFVCAPPERDLHRQILEHLRSNRNAAVHAAAQKDDVLAMVYQAKWYAEELLRFHLDQARRFTSIKQAGAALGMPLDPELLRWALDYQRWDAE